MAKRWLGVGLGVAATVLWASVATSASAQAPRTVVWLEHGELGARTERERALQLELEARDIVLLESSPPPLPPGTPRPSAYQTASLVLARSGATAVVWLEAGSEGPPVSWLFARLRGDLDVVKAPLPHPPDVIDPQLLAIAAASLLDQLLSEKAVSAPAPPPAPPVPTPKQVAAIAPLSPAEVRSAQPAPQPLPPSRTFFVQLGFALTLAHLHTGMEASSKPSLDEVFNDRFVAIDPADPHTRDLASAPASRAEPDARDAAVGPGSEPPAPGADRDARVEHAEQLANEADALRSLGRAREAVDRYLQAHAALPPPAGASAAFKAADLCLRVLSDPSRTLRVLDQTGLDAPGSPLRERALLLRIDAAERLGRPVRDLAERYLEEYPDSAGSDRMRSLSR